MNSPIRRFSVPYGNEIPSSVNAGQSQRVQPRRMDHVRRANDSRVIGEILRGVPPGCFFDMSDIITGRSERAMGAVCANSPPRTGAVQQVFHERRCQRPGCPQAHPGIRGKSLQRVGTDYLTCISATASIGHAPRNRGAMDDRSPGKILYWGTSDWTGAQLREIHAVCENATSVSPRWSSRYNLLARKAFETGVPAAGIWVWAP